MSPVRVLAHGVQRSVARARASRHQVVNEEQEGRVLAERLGMSRPTSELLGDFKRQTEGAPVVRRVARPVG